MATTKATRATSAEPAGDATPAGKGRAPRHSDEQLVALVKETVAPGVARSAGGVDVHLYRTGRGASWPRLKAAWAQALEDGMTIPEKAPTPAPAEPAPKARQARKPRKPAAAK